MVYNQKHLPIQDCGTISIWLSII